MSRRRLTVFRAGLASCAAAVAAASWAWVRPDASAWVPAAGLVLVGLLATQFPLHLSLTHKVSVATAVFFATALLMPAPQAALVAAATELASTGVSVARRTLATRVPPPARAVAASLAFNASQGYLAVSSAGAVLAVGHVSVHHAEGPAWPVVIGLAAAAMYAVNLSAVSITVALTNGTSPVRVFRDTQSLVATQFGGLYLLGAILAWVAVRMPWLLALAPLPVGAVYVSLRRVQQLSRETVRAVERMAELVDRRDVYTYEHSRRVAEYTVLIARRLGLSRDEVELVRLAARVHDLGKIGVPDGVLLKPGRLTAEEQAQMAAHPRLGYDILAEFSEYAKVRDLVLTHHERWSGGGYPRGIAAAGLPLVAQVIPVADSLDAMTTARPYRGPLPWSVALAELEKGAGSQWNPRVVAAALAVFDESARREHQAGEPGARKMAVSA